MNSKHCHHENSKTGCQPIPAFVTNCQIVDSLSFFALLIILVNYRFNSACSFEFDFFVVFVVIVLQALGRFTSELYPLFHI